MRVGDDEAPHAAWLAVGAQVLQGHRLVSEMWSKLSPICSVVWYRPMKWPASWATMYATESGPHRRGENVEPQLVVSIRSEPFAAAPLLTVPPMLDGPGIVPSTPTTLMALPAAFLKPFTRKMLIWLPGWDSVKSRLKGPHGESSSALMLPPRSEELFTHGCMSYKVTLPMQIPALA